MAVAQQGTPPSAGREARILAALFLATLLPRLLLLVLGRVWDPAVVQSTVISYDAAGYQQRALTVFGPGGFYPPDVGIDYIRPPLFPLFAALLYRLAGVHPWHILLGHAILSGISCLLLYRAVRDVISRPAAIFMGLAFALDPSLILQSNLFLSEMLFLFFLAMAMACLRGPLETRLGPRSYRALMAVGLCVGLATLTRPAGQFIPLVLAPLFFVVAPRPLRRPILASLLVAAVFLGAVAPWALRNQAAFGVPSISVVQDWSPLFKVLVAPVESARTGESLLQVDERLERETALLARTEGVDVGSLNEFQRARYWRRLTLQYFRRDPAAYALLCARRTVLFFTNLQTSAYGRLLRLRNEPTDLGGEHAVPLTQIASAWVAKKTAGEKLLGLWTLAWLGLSYVCLGVGLRVAWVRGLSPLLLACLVLALGFIAAGAPVGEARFRTSALLCYLPFVGIGADYLWSRRPRTASRRARHPDRSAAPPDLGAAS